MEPRLALLQNKKIRKTVHEGERWFALIDVIVAITGTIDPKGYLKDMRRTDPALAAAFKGKSGLSPLIMLELPTTSGRQPLRCWHTAGIYRLIQSIPSRKAEPYRRWLVKMGYGAKTSP